jgi:signal transduction histidine kinase
MQPKGHLTVKTLRDGEDTVLAVQDEGIGIEPEILEKIGTPFFTTKDNGTGLGLATCYSIAERHNARIDIDTCETGTTFYVRFRK